MHNPDLIKNYTIAEFQEQVWNINLPKYRANQIFTAIYTNRVNSWDEITTLPLELRSILAEKFIINSLEAKNIQYSQDGTIKFLFGLFDGYSIESVLIPEFDEDEDGKLLRNTLCVSSQVGCALDCAFCATGKLKLGRNLVPAEIIDQVLTVEKITGQKITNIVFMGMGEPLQNYENVIKAINILSDEKTKVISRKKITVSTSGIVPKIYDLADEPKPVKLALSLHATTNGLREKLMPVAKKWKITDLRNALEYYYRQTRIPITLEYIMFDGLNDTPEDAKRLAKFVRAYPSKVNIIPFHDISFTSPSGFAKELKPSTKEHILQFAATLRGLGVYCFIRKSSGFDIDAACGQLAYSQRTNAISQ